MTTDKQSKMVLPVLPERHNTNTASRAEVGAMVYTATSRVQMHYRYVNQHPGPVSVWLALPPELPTQRDLQIDLAPAPASIEVDGNGINRLAFYQLEPGAAIRLSLQATLYRAAYEPAARAGQATLDPADHDRYLRSSALIRVTDEIRAEAQRIVAGATTPLDRARRLYLHLVRHYRYQWPPTARGSESMRRNQRGDCAEYSFLYAAWCRALGIPCRVMIGTWAHGQLNAHVWNEVFIEGIGWMPVDSSIHQTLLRVPGLADLDWALQRVRHRFGRISPRRLAFSIDPDVPLRPPFREREAPERYERMQFADRQFAWGFDSLDGAAPYLQPAYVQLTAPLDETTGSAVDQVLALFWPPLVARKVAPLLGVWRFTDSIWYRLGTWLMILGFTVGLFNTILDAAWGIETLALPGALGYFAGMIIFTARSGLRWWKLLLILLQALPLLGVLLRLVL